MLAAVLWTLRVGSPGSRASSQLCAPSVICPWIGLPQRVSSSRHCWFDWCWATPVLMGDEDGRRELGLVRATEDD
jgi:hypothetical protein